MKYLLCFFLFILAVNCIAQNAKYKYEYRLRLPDIPSYWYWEQDTSNITLKDQTTQDLIIKVVDQYGGPEYFSVKVLIQFENGDTLKLKPDTNGVVICKLPQGDFRIAITNLNSPSLNSIFPYRRDGRNWNIIAILGVNHKLKIPKLRSKRQLNEREIIEITNDLRTGKRKSRLILDKTCYVTYEI